MATVQDSGGSPLSAGRVLFCDESLSTTSCQGGAKLAEVWLVRTTAKGFAVGSATLKRRFSIGSHRIRARYVQNANYAASSSDVEEVTVSANNWLPSTTTIAAGAVDASGAYPLTATITSQTLPAPSDTVRFFDTTDASSLGDASLSSSTLALGLIANTGVAAYNLSSIAVGDINNDGYLDAILGYDSSSTATVMIGDAHGNLTTAGSVAINIPYNIHLADLNGDGVLDIFAATHSDERIMVALGNGDGSFGTPFSITPSPFTKSPNVIEVADLNGDGLPDLVMSQNLRAHLYFFLNDGNTSDLTFTEASTEPTSDGYVKRMAVGDFNEDGYDDVAYGSEYTNKFLRLALANSTQSYLSTTLSADGSVPGGTENAVVGDLNNDGHLDIVFMGKAGNQSVVLLGKGDGSFTQHQIIAEIADPEYPATLTDFDGDGNLDLMVNQYSSPALYYYKGDGTGTLTLAESHSKDASHTTVFGVNQGTAIAAGDFNGDGYPDMLLGDNNRTFSHISLQTSQTATANITVYDTSASNTHAVRAQYSGSNSYAASNSDTVSLTPVTLAKQTVSVTLDSPLNSEVTYGTVSSGAVNASGSCSGAITLSVTGPATLSSTSSGGTLTITGAGTISIKATAAATSACAPGVAYQTIKVDQATPTVSVWPTASSIAYGQTLASSTLTGGTSSAPGTFAWTTPSTAPIIGTASYNVTFTPSDTTDYSTVTGSVSITTGKATPTISAWPTASSIAYGQTLASSTLTGGSSSVPGTFAWTAPSTAPSAGAANYSVTFTPTDSTDYSTVTGSVSITTNKTTPSISAWPTATSLTYGQTLASSTLTGGSPSVPGTFVWTAPSTAPSAGTANYSVTFTPTDSTDYSAVTGSISVTTGKATPTVSSWPTASSIAYGQTLASSTLTGGSSSVPGTFVWTTPSTEPAIGTASYNVTFTPSDAADYSPVTGSISITTSKATPTISAWPSASSITYGQTLASSTLTGGTSSVPGSFAWTTPSTAPSTGTANYSVIFTPADSIDYSTVTGSVSITTSKVTPTISAWPSASSITYGQTLASSTLTGGVSSVPGSFAWTTPSTAPSTGTANYNVTFTPTDSTDYSTVAASVSLSTGKATPTISAWPSASSITYGQTLASSTLTGGTSSVPGSFAWTTPSTAPAIGAASYNVTFTPSDTNDYNTVTESVSITTNKVMPTINAWPSASSIAYGQTLASSSLTGGSSSVAGSFAWTTPSTAPSAGTASYSVTFMPTDSTDYSTVTGSISITTGKATPTISTWPSASSITYGQTLASSTLTGGASSVPGSFTWMTPSTAPSAGTASYSITFTPTDSTDYSTVTGSVSVITGKATPTISAWPSASSIAYGQTLASSTLTGGASSVPGTFAWTTPSTAPSAGTANYSVTFTPSDTTNFITVTDMISVTTTSTSFTITDASNSTPTQTVVPGSIASFDLTFTPAAGAFSKAVTFAVSGLPAGATVLFSPTSITAGSAATTVTMTVHTAAATALNTVPFGGTPKTPFALALLLLPLAITKRMRSHARRWMLVLFVLTALGASTVLTGCGGGNLSHSEKSYSVTITATSGAIIQTHTVTLNIQ